MQKDNLGHERGHLKTFPISYMLNSKNRVFNPYFFNLYLSNKKSLLAENSRAEPTILSMEQISYPLKLLSSHFYG